MHDSLLVAPHLESPLRVWLCQWEMALFDPLYRIDTQPIIKKFVTAYSLTGDYVGDPYIAVPNLVHIRPQGLLAERVKIVVRPSNPRFWVMRAFASA